MPDTPRRSPARLLAPIALAAAALAVVVVLSTSGVVDGGDDRGGGGEPGTTEQTLTPAEPDRPRRPRRRTTYTVQSGDTLDEIAEKTRVDAETIQELNPELDPVALTTGEKIKLRE